LGGHPLQPLFADICGGIVPLIRRDSRATFSPLLWEKGFSGQGDLVRRGLMLNVLPLLFAGICGVVVPLIRRGSRATFSPSLWEKGDFARRQSNVARHSRMDWL